jgi:hypothetical protein
LLKAIDISEENLLVKNIIEHDSIAESPLIQ